MKTASTLPLPLRRYWATLALFTGISIVYTATTAHLYHLQAPFGLTLRWGYALYNDFLIFRPGFLAFGTARFWDSFDYPFTYPAPVGVAFGLLYKLQHPVRDYLALFFVALAGAAWWFVRELGLRGVGTAVAWSFTATTLAMTWPLYVLVDTANVEGLVAILFTAGVFAVWRERWALGATLIGIAGAMKIFPLLLLVLLLSTRRYKEFVWGLAVAAAVTIASLALLGPSILEAQRHVDFGMLYVRHWIMFSMLRFAPAFDHSMWLPVRFGIVYADRLIHPLPAELAAARTEVVLRASLTVYLCAVAALGAIAYVWKIRRLPMLNQLIILMICAVLLPPMSIDYTLINLLLPFALLCLYAADMGRGSRNAKGLASCFGCFAIIFGMNSFLNHKYLFAAEARTAALIVLLCVSISNPFESARAQ